MLRLALAAYEAAVEPELWPDFLKRYTEAISAEMSFFQTHRLGSQNSTIAASFGIVPRFTQDYNEHYSKLNVWREGGRHLYVAGRVNLDQEMCPRPVLERSEFYNDHLLRIGVSYCMAAVIAREGETVPTLTSLRGRSKGAFDETDRQIPSFLAPHLNRAWRFVQRLELLAAAESVLDESPQGIVFLSTGGAAISWNRLAGEVFAEADGLMVRKGVLSANDRRADARLRKAIDDALAPSQPPEAGTVAIPRLSMLRDYQVVTAPLRSHLPRFAGMRAPSALVLITDPERQPRANPELLIQMYKLTRREATLAVKLSEGKSVERAAEELSITYETARTHLRRVFSKTSTSRQAELLLLMARLPSRLGGEDG